jgi:hypothetical protein
MKNKTKLFYKNEGIYNRYLEIGTTERKCLVCNTETKVLEIDNSNGEYSVVRICKNCIEKIFNDEMKVIDTIESNRLSDCNKNTAKQEEIEAGFAKAMNKIDSIECEEELPEWDKV